MKATTQIRTRLHLDNLSLRDVPATLSLGGGALLFTGGTGNDNLTVTLGTGNTYNFHDAGQAIIFGDGLDSWRGSGTQTATGTLDPSDTIGIDLLGGTDTLALEATVNTVSVVAGATTNQIAISSNGLTATGTLLGIQASVSVSASAGNTALVISDYGEHATRSVTITGGSGVTTVSGLSADDISFGSSGGSFSLVRLIGMDASDSSQSFTFTDPTVPVRLDTSNAPNNAITINSSSQLLTINGGSNGNSFSVLGDAVANLTGWTGNDSFYVAPDVTLTGSIHGRGGNDAFDIEGTVTGGVYIY